MKQHNLLAIAAICMLVAGASYSAAQWPDGEKSSGPLQGPTNLGTPHEHAEPTPTKFAPVLLKQPESTGMVWAADDGTQEAAEPTTSSSASSGFLPRRGAEAQTAIQSSRRVVPAEAVSEVSPPEASAPELTQAETSAEPLVTTSPRSLETAEAPAAPQAGTVLRNPAESSQEMEAAPAPLAAPAQGPRYAATASRGEASTSTPAAEAETTSPFAVQTPAVSQEVVEPAGETRRLASSSSMTDAEAVLQSETALLEPTDEVTSTPPLPADTQIGTSEASVSARWEVPAEVNVGEEASCRLIVENHSGRPLAGVTVQAEIPAEVKVGRTEPQATRQGQLLIWNLEKLPAAGRQELELGLTPNSETELRPVATIMVQQSVAAELRIVRPQLALEIVGSGESMVGQAETLLLEVGNSGSGTATGVIVSIKLGESLHHPRGSQIEYELGSLGPGMTRRVQVPVTPLEPGLHSVMARVQATRADDATAVCELETHAPRLQVAVKGPKLRYVDRKAEYVITVTNPGPVAANNVRLLDRLPEGVRYLGATAGATYDDSVRQVAWFVGRLEAEETAEVVLEVLPTAQGHQTLLTEVVADAGVREQTEMTTEVRGFASLELEVTETDDPVEVAGETVYEIRVTNTGSTPAHDVQVAAQLSSELRAIEATGPVSGTVTPSQVVYPPIEVLAPGESKLYRIKANCLETGNARFRAYVRSLENDAPVLKEEVTRIYEG